MYGIAGKLFVVVVYVHGIVENKLHLHLISDTLPGNRDDIGWRQARGGILLSIKLKRRDETGTIRYLPNAGKNEQGTSEKRAYARLISKETKKLDEICSFINECCSVNSADIKGVLDALSKYVGRELSYGSCVELDGLGFFSPSLKTVKDGVNEKGEELYKVKVDGVNFRCAKKLKRRCAKASL